MSMLTKDEWQTIMFAMIALIMAVGVISIVYYVRTTIEQQQQQGYQQTDCPTMILTPDPQYTQPVTTTTFANNP